MPTKKKPIDELLDTPVDREQEELFDFLDTLGEGVAVVDIALMRPDGSRPHAKRVTMEILRENPYDILRAIRPGEDAKYLLSFKGADRRILTSRVVDILGVKEPVSPPVAAPNGDSALERMLLFQQQNSDKMWQLMVAVIGGLAQRPIPEFKMPDPAVMLNSVVSAWTALKGPNPTENVIEQVRPILELARDFSGNGGGEDSLVKDLVKGFAPAVVQGFTQGRPPAPIVQTIHPGTSIPPVHPVPHLAPAPSSQPQVVHEVKGGPPTVQQLVAQQVGYLKKKALLSRPVEDWINYVLDETDEPGCQAVCYVVQNGATFENLLELDPEIGQNPQLTTWFRKLYDGIRAELSASVHSGRSSGDESHPTDHETARPAGQP